MRKALEKERSRRYATASGLAADLARHLNNEPVAAAAPSSLYRLRRFVRRNRGPVTAAAAIAVVLVLGVAVSTWQWRKAVEAAASREQQRDLAQQQAVEADKKRDNAVNQQRRAEDLLAQVQIQRAEELFALDDDPAAVATLARVLRIDPSNHVAAQRLISVLSHGDFPLEAAPSPDTKLASVPQRLLVNANGALRVVDAATGASLGKPVWMRSGDAASPAGRETER